MGLMMMMMTERGTLKEFLDDTHNAQGDVLL